MFVILFIFSPPVSAGPPPALVDEVVEDQLDRAQAAGESELSITTTFAEPVSSKAGVYDRVELDGCEPWHIPGAPLLPAKRVAVLIPEGKEAVEIICETGEEIELPGRYYLEPGAFSCPISRPDLARPRKPDLAIYSSSLPYPASPLFSRTPQLKMGYRIENIAVVPFKYFPAERKLSFYQSVTVKILLRDRNSAGRGATICRGLPADREEVRNLVINPGILRGYASRPLPGPVGETPASAARRAGLSDCEHLIITTESLADSFETLRSYRSVNGVSSAIVTLEEIIADPAYRWDGEFGDGDSFFEDTSCRIRNCIKDAYRNHGTRFVLLGGAIGQIPIRLLGETDDEEVINLPADLYYGCLDGSFNYNKHDCWGEQSDGPDGGDVDLSFEVHVGRAAVISPEEAGNIIDKTIAYEQSRSRSLKNIVMLGEQVGFGGIMEYAEPSLEEIRLGTCEHGYCTTGFASNGWFDLSRNLYDSVDGAWLEGDLIRLVNGGVHVLNHLGHGFGYKGLKLWGDNPWGYPNDLPLFTNTDPFFGYSQACWNGKLDIPTTAGWGGYRCLWEQITAMKHGAFAFIGNSGTGLCFGIDEDPTITDGEAQRYNRCYWDGLFGQGIQEVGALLSRAREYNLYRINEQNMRYQYYELNLFGDPVTRFHSDGWNFNPAVLAGGDYDGDGTDDIAGFRGGLWSVRNLTRLYFGTVSDIPVPGDYNGDGTYDPAVFRSYSDKTPAQGPSCLWAVRGLTRFYYGRPSGPGFQAEHPWVGPSGTLFSDVPVPGDYDGDGITDAAVFRPSSGLWGIRGVTRVYFGISDDLAVPGDYSGDGTNEIALFRPARGLWAIRNITRVYFGSSSDTSIPGDYNGDGTWETGIFRESSGLWAIRGMTRSYFGSSMDQPIPGDYKGDGRDDFGIFRNSSGLWAIKGISRAYFGSSGDLPVTR